MTNTMLYRRSLVLSIVLIAGMGSVACSGGPTQNSSTTTSAPASSAASNPVAEIDPCSLLSPSDVTSLGLASRGPESTGKSRGCGWTKSTSYSVGIYANESQGLDELRVANSTTASLQSHDAIQTSNSSIDCLFDIAITKTSSVDVSVEVTGDNPCQIAAQYATLIEPKLPAQQK